jgi:hypothetical protein
MALERPIRDDWATIPLTPTEDMGDDPLEGPEGLMVVFPNKDALPHDLLWLGRSIFVYVMNGPVTHFTKYRIRQHIADRLDVNARTFMIADVDERNAHYILICPDEMTKIRALNLGALTIEPPARRMSGLTHSARIRLREDDDVV